MVYKKKNVFIKLNSNNKWYNNTLNEVVTIQFWLVDYAGNCNLFDQEKLPALVLDFETLSLNYL